MAIIEVKNFTFVYPKAQQPALGDVSFSVNHGEFVLLCGETGCGKTTLLRNLKPEIAPHGAFEGSIVSEGGAFNIGFVMQNPESQIVTDTVWHELAFGLENMGLPSDIIRRRVGETALFFGIEAWFESSVYELSGGQKQILNLAAVTAMQPDIILLDEPTAQLDPIASKNFTQMLRRINSELGKTVVLCEHRLEEALPMCGRVLNMRDGALEFDGTPADFARFVRGKPYFGALPACTRFAMQYGEQVPLNVRHARAWLSGYGPHKFSVRIAEPQAAQTKSAISAKDIWFRYGAKTAFVLKGWGLDVPKGHIHFIVGGNGSGKSTALGVLSGVYKPDRGRVKISPGLRVSLMVQNPKAVFSCDTLIADLTDSAQDQAAVTDIARQFSITHLLHRHPYDLSGGEMQKAALAKTLLRKPDILLLDEPTKGFDAAAKAEFGEILGDLSQSGVTIVVVTHDVEFAAAYAHTCSMLFNGTAIASGEGKAFFNGNSYYTTDINRMTRGLIDGCVLPEDIQCNEPSE